MADLLFYGKAHLSQVFEAIRTKLKQHVADMSPSQMNAASDDEIVQHVVAEFRIEPVSLHTDKLDGIYTETKVDVSRDPMRFVTDRDRPCLIAGNKITVRLPFSGDPGLFEYTPSTHTLSPPRGRVRKNGDSGGTVEMELARPADTGADDFNRWIEGELKSLEQHATWARNDVERFNAELDAHARDAISRRRAQLVKQGDLLSQLKIPIRKRDDAPNPAPLPMPKRVVKPLPAPRKVEQEYGLSDADYDYILQILRHESRSFEQTPEPFRKLGEEELRDVILAHLNGHFQGEASGERFRRKGKTDICIEYENRAAFIAECKVWGGAKVANEALDQLLGYLTWRDCRTSLVLFNKTVKGFKALQDGMPALLAAHPRFVQHATSGHAGEWRAVFRAKGDDDRLITVHVFLVDLSPDGEAVKE